MKTIIYRISDGFHAGTIPEGGTFENELQLNVFPNFGGHKEDYGSLDVLFDYFKLEQVSGGVIAVEIEPPPISDSEPSKEDLMGLELAKIKLDNFQNLLTINQLGADLTKAKLDIIQIKGGI